jgi:hypothetical protein
MGHAEFFLMLAAICVVAAVALRLLDGRARHLIPSPPKQSDSD